MAIRKTIEIDVNTIQAVGGLDNLSKALELVDASAKGVDATFEEVYGDLKPLTARMGEAEDRLYELALAGKSTTQEYKDLLASVGQYRQVQMQTDMVVDASASTFDNKLGGALQGVTSAFAGVQGAMALTGGQSEELEAALVKVQGAMALAEGVRGIREGITSFKALSTVAQRYTIVQKGIAAAQWLWNAAVAANPIGAIIAGIVALVAAGVALTRYFNSNAEAAKNNAAAVEKNRLALDSQTKTLERNSVAFDRKQNQELAMAKASGASAKAIRELELKLIDEKIAYEKSQRAIAENTYQKNLNTIASLKAAGADEEVIKKQVDVTNESIKQYNKQNQDVQKAFDERKDIQNRHLVEIRTAQTESSKKESEKRKEDAKKASEEAAADLKAQKQALKSIEEKFLKEIEDLKATTEIQKLNLQKERDLKELENIKLSQEEKEKAKTAIIEKYRLLNFKAEQDDLNAFKAILSQAAEEDNQRKLESDQAQADSLNAIAAFSTEQSIKNNEEQSASAQALADHKAALQEQSFALANGAIGFLKEIAGKNKALQKAAVIAENAMGIAKIITSTQAANAAVVAKYSLIPGGQALAATEIAMNKIGAGIGIATTLASTAKALAAIGGGGSAGSSPNVGGGAAGTAPAPPQFNVIGNSGVNQIAATLGNQQPIQTYVVANQVTTQQALDRSIVNNASL